MPTDAPADPPTGDPAGPDDDPTAIADDGMAPLVTNTGVDDSDDDADASTG